ncbi:MAG: SIMPL domain-containing protein [Candidatus Omnitrophota bacterium]
MERENFLKSIQIIVLGICIAIGTLGASYILSQGFVKIFQMKEEVVKVTGSAERKIHSDKVIWHIGFSKRALDLKAAYADLEKDLGIVRAYLLKQGVLEPEMTVQQAQTTVLYKKNEKGYDTNEIEGYRVEQSIEVQSADVTKIDTVSRRATELIHEGVEAISYAPSFFYTRLSELKHDLLREAIQDAKGRAEKMLSATQNRVGFMRSGSSGVFQITPENSTSVSDWGENDTSALRKKVTAVVHAEFAIL